MKARATASHALFSQPRSATKPPTPGTPQGLWGKASVMRPRCTRSAHLVSTLEAASLAGDYVCCCRCCTGANVMPRYVLLLAAHVPSMAPAPFTSWQADNFLRPNRPSPTAEARTFSPGGCATGLDARGRSRCRGSAIVSGFRNVKRHRLHLHRLERRRKRASYMSPHLCCTLEKNKELDLCSNMHLSVHDSRIAIRKNRLGGCSSQRS